MQYSKSCWWRHADRICSDLTLSCSVLVTAKSAIMKIFDYENVNVSYCVFIYFIPECLFEGYDYKAVHKKFMTSIICYYDHITNRVWRVQLEEPWCMFRLLKIHWNWNNDFQNTPHINCDENSFFLFRINVTDRWRGNSYISQELHNE